jgi:hypothetical protein
MFGIEPKIEHYGYMIDLIGRGGKFLEAKELIIVMHSVDTRVSDMVILGALQKINLYTNMKIS